MVQRGMDNKTIEILKNINYADVARLYPISREAVRRWLVRGKIPKKRRKALSLYTNIPIEELE